MSDVMDRFIAAVSVLGLLVLLATASSWGPIVDGQQAKPECAKVRV
jgi:hypothetical protein